MNGIDRSFGAVVFRDSGADRRFLLVHHAKGGHWDHPKGHPETGETPRETALREIREEGCVSVRFIGDFSTEASWILPDGREKRVMYYLAQKSGEVQPSVNGNEILDLAWLPLDGAMERLTYTTGRRVLEAARLYLSENPVS